MPVKAALQLIRDHYAASARGDLDGMVAPFADDIEWTEMAGFPYAGTYTGPRAVREGVFQRIGTEWAGYQAVPEDYVCEGDRVVAFGLYSGTFRGTGKYMEARFTHYWTLRDGRVTRFEQFTDTLLVREAMS